YAVKGFDASSASEGIEDDAFGNAHDWLRLKVFHVFAGVQLATLIMPRSASTDNGFASLPRWTIAWQFGQGMLW
ncbi:TPA: hypothetical protein OTU03_004419, partial [Escherichia coli]|nr:hypothetical protein [Escherichia coli]